MKPGPVWWMAGASLLAWAAVTAVLGLESALEGLAGAAAPLAAAVGSWVVTERTHRTRPERLMSVMVSAFAAKMAFFGAYVILMLGALSLRPVPFMVSFTGSYVTLHAMEAFYLRRLSAR
jgi:hypothetical protein